MASAYQIVLSSSPLHTTVVTTPLRRSYSPISSSPLLPSPSQLFARKATAKIIESNDSFGIIAGISSTTAVRGSTPAVGNIREGTSGIGKIYGGNGETSHVESRKHEDVEPQAGKEGSAKSSKKRPVSTSTTRKPRKKSTAVAENSKTLSHTNQPEQQGIEKKVSKKKAEEMQSKIAKSRITKPGDNVAKGGKAASTKKELHQVNNSEPVGPLKHKASNAPAGKESLDLLLAEAVRRRRVWTPPKDTPQEVLHLEKLDRAAGENITLKNQECGKLPLHGFENLQGDFGYADERENLSYGLESCRSTNGEALTKRRKLELVNLAPSLPAARPRKTKSPKKKPQTVTGKATAPFLAAESGAPSLLQYLEAEAPVGNQEAYIEDPMNTMPAPEGIRRKLKPKALTKPSSGKPKNKSKPSPVIHSPRTAIKSTVDQDLIFGTSSQLAREESPTCLRDIQQAIKESQSMSEESSISMTGNLTPSISCDLPERAGVLPFAASRNLWSVASRDLDGSLLDVEIIDLVDTPRPRKLQPSTSIFAPPAILSLEDGRNFTAEGDTYLASTSDADKQQSLKEPSSSDRNGLFLEQPIPRSIAEAALRNRRQSRSPVKKQKIPKDSDMPQPDPLSKQMPNYQGFTTADLSKEVASFGFKAIKKRTEMIALLERCWESQARIALQTLQPNVKAVKPLVPPKDDSVAQIKSSKGKGKLPEPDTTVPISNVTLSPPKKPRGRPRKPPAASSHLPPQEPSQVLGPVPLVPCTTSSLETEMFAQITNAINAAPATHSISHPTFHERILLYDPIVLEDLTAWLNTEGLGRVGTDGEVGIGVVRKWCEKESICCLSRGR